MDRKKLYFTAAGVGAGLLVRSALQRPRGENLYGKVVLITGGAHALGLPLARAFAAEGSRLASCDRDQAQLEVARRQLEGPGTRVFAVRCDVTNPAQVDGMAEAVLEHYGGIDVLVNNACAPEPSAAEEMALADFEQAMEAIFWGVVYPTRAVLPHMLERRAGRIVNITSENGHLAPSQVWPQDCARFAAIGFSEGLRSEVLARGISVVTIAPQRLSIEQSRAARQIVTATLRGEANGISPRHESKFRDLLGGFLPPPTEGRSPSQTPIMSALSVLGRMAARRYLQP